MLNFKCRVIEPNGEVIEIIESSETSEKLRQSLVTKGYTVLSIAKESRNTSSKLKPAEVLQFTQTLSLLVNSNLSLKDSLAISIESYKSSKLISLTKYVIAGLSKGESFSGLIGQERWGFPKIYIGLIRVGEKTGTIKSIIEQLNNYLEQNKKVKDKIGGALVYPTFIVIMASVFGVLLAFLLLPKFNTMFGSIGGDISTIMNSRAASFKTLMISIISIILLFYLFSLYVKRLKKVNITSAARFEKLLLRIPRIGNFILSDQSFNLLFALKILSKSNLSIEDSLQFAKEVLTNSFLILEVEMIREKILKGEKLSIAFKHSYFPERISSFINVGEKTGDITSIFDRLSDSYMKENTKQIDIFIALIDPLFTVMIGGALLVLIVLFVLPLLTTMGDLL